MSEKAKLDTSGESVDPGASQGLYAADCWFRLQAAGKLLGAEAAFEAMLQEFWSVPKEVEEAHREALERLIWEDPHAPS